MKRAHKVACQQELLPAKPLFFRYVAVLCGINAGAVMGAFLLGLHVRVGYCLYGTAELLYNALLPPVCPLDIPVPENDCRQCSVIRVQSICLTRNALTK